MFLEKNMMEFLTKQETRRLVVIATAATTTTTTTTTASTTTATTTTTTTTSTAVPAATSTFEQIPFQNIETRFIIFLTLELSGLDSNSAPG